VNRPPNLLQPVEDGDPSSAEGKTNGSRLGIVIIGRNEGERLRRCLASLIGRASLLVYVDSGSTDGSVPLAAEMGADVVELEHSLPFTAARARNAGWAKALEIAPDLELVDFVDGDCEVAPDWLEKATRTLLADPSLAVVCGRRRERNPAASIYNRLCDIEWNTPVGLADACGGDALMRIQPLAEVGGYNSDLIAGEEPDLCFRLRQRGYRILRIDAEMTLHDANITRFGQWWRRTIRSGHAYAEGFTRHRNEPGSYCAKQVRSNLFWGVALPALAFGLVPLSAGWSAVLLSAYLAMGIRVFRSSLRRGLTSADARLYALFCVIGKIPSAYGQLSYWARLVTGKRSTLIEYKRAGT
jgi:glycosyltransferase involved in cell wall biosynthesis